MQSVVVRRFYNFVSASVGFLGTAIPKSRALFLFVTLASLSLLISESHAADTDSPAVPGEFLVRFSRNVSSLQQRNARRALAVDVLRNNSISGSQLVRVQNGKSFDHDYAKRLLASGEVDYIEPNYIISIHQTLPNDSRFSELWGMHNSGQNGGTVDVDIDGPEAWNLTSGTTSVIVGVVDTGINAYHPDLSSNIWVNPNEIPGNGIDDDGNGVVDDVHGYSAISDDGDIRDQNGHGTHCAGTIGAMGNNGLGVTGVNWNVRIMPLKFLDSSGFGTTQGAIAAIEYAVKMKRSGVNLRVLSNSWGGGSYSEALEEAISAANDAGILFVAAAGNNANDNDIEGTYPANYSLPNIISVAAVDRHGNLATFSNYGATTVDLAAPGVDILSTTLGDAYQSLSGTSMATPHVSGIAALVLSRESNLTTSQLKTRLSTTAKPLSTLTGLMSSPGIVSANNALLNSRTPLPPPQTVLEYKYQETTIKPETKLGERILTDDDGYTKVELPFSFSYYGRNFNSAAVSSNGRIIPLAEGEALPSSPDYSNSLKSGIHPYHDDLFPSPHNPAQAGVWALIESNSVTFSWIAVHYAHRNEPNPEVEVRVQAKVNSNGVIEFHYLDTFTGDEIFDYGASASVGLAPVSGVPGAKLIVSHNSTNPARIGNGKAQRMYLPSHATPKDFDGDAKSDLAVWRPSTGFWYILTSSSGFDFSAQRHYQLGLPGDIPLIGDYDGDQKADLAVWRPSNGTWYFRTSGSNYQVITSMQWGLYGDTPLVGDYDGDARTDLCVYRPQEGVYYVLLSSGGFNRNAALSGVSQSVLTIALGGLGHDPVIGDFSGDGKTDFTTVWQLLRFWSVKTASGALLDSQPWGESGDTPVVCDWDGDGISDRFAVRISKSFTLDWYGVQANGEVTTSTFGSLGDIPRCNSDYDGDGKGDQEVFRPQSGQWFIRLSETGEYMEYPFGLSGDIAP